jgi:dTDP-glucose 4,6-dehydratase
LSYFSGKKVLVTGAGGFIGSHLAERLVQEGADVTAFVRYNGPGKWGWLDQSEVVGDMTVVTGDIADQESVSSAMRNQEIVFHLAALIAIPYSYQAPRSYVRTNVEGTLNVVQSAREMGTARVVHTSTSEVYGTARKVPIGEDHELQGQSPYSASKIGADKIAESYHLSFGVPVTTIRPFNTFGPRQSARAVIPTIITQLLKGEQVKLGSVTPTRDLNFVSNTVDGFLKGAMVPEAIGRTINLGSGREISISDLAQLIAKMMGSSIEVETEGARIRPENSEVERLLADASLAASILNWKAEVTLEEGLEQTIRWLERHLDHYRVGVYAV